MGAYSMSITHCKSQQQTLSIRVSDSLREFLELAREFITDGRGEAVSISDVAKLLLESARQDRLDFRLEAAELQQSPTSSLLHIRRKWEQEQALSRAEWAFLVRYVQVACEERSGNTTPPSPDSFIAVLEALLAVRSLRTGRGGGLDRFYLGNLDVPVATVFNERQFDPELLPRTVDDLIQGLRQGENSLNGVVFAGRNLYVALRDEAVNDVVALNRSLTAYLGVLFRLAARGHWIRERRPLRMPRDVSTAAQVIESSDSGPFQVTASMQDGGDLTVLIEMHHRGVRYPLGSYPEIREFEAMLRQLDRGQVWNGGHFFATTEATETEGQLLFVFGRRTDGVLFTFSETEWRCLDGLFQQALARPELRALLDRLSLEYGDI
jgi:hypothetical protein